MARLESWGALWEESQRFVELPQVYGPVANLNFEGASGRFDPRPGPAPGPACGRLARHRTLKNIHRL